MAEKPFCFRFSVVKYAHVQQRQHHQPHQQAVHLHHIAKRKSPYVCPQENRTHR